MPAVSAKPGTSSTGCGSGPSSGPESFPVRRCLQAILSEEWEHRLYAERDFDLLQARRPEHRDGAY